MKQHEKRSRSNKQHVVTTSYKKPMTSEFSDIGAESTTIGVASDDCYSPTLGEKNKPRAGLSLDTSRHQLNTVTEFPSSAKHNDYRKKRLLNKGCPKLLRMVKAHESDIEKE